MGGKPRKAAPKRRKTTDEMSPDELRELVSELRQRLFTCLKFCKFPSGMMYRGDPSSAHLETYVLETAVMDCLDKAGIVVDRKAYWKRQR